MPIDERKIMKQEVLFSKLFGAPSFGSLDTLMRNAEEVEIPLCWRFHRIIVVEVETWGELLARGRQAFEPDDRSEANFVLTNICSATFKMDGQCHVCFADYQGRIVFWIDSEENCCETEAFVQTAEDAVRLLESEFQLVVTFSISDWFEDLFQTFEIYQNTLNMMFFFRYLSSPRSVYAMDFFPAESSPLTLNRRCHTDRQLLEAIKNGDFGGIKSLLLEAYRTRFSEGAVSMQQFPMRHAAFREILESTATELLQWYPVDSISLSEILQIVTAAETAVEQIEAIDALVDDIAAVYGPGLQKSSPDWVETLTEYVKAHYTDPNMTVYQLAELVKLTPSYCTRVFRSYMGMTLLEYIQRQRVQAAIASLEAGETMAKAAEKSGFSSTQTLRRTLKQYHAR